MSQAARNKRQYRGRIGQKEKAVIHIARNQIGMEDDVYRELLQSFGVKSSKDLTRGQFYELMEAFNRAGFVNRQRALEPGSAEPTSRTLMLDKIQAQLSSMDLPWSYADAMATRMFKRRYIRWCTARELGKVVAALWYKQKKLGVSDEPGSHLGGDDLPRTPADSGPQGSGVKAEAEPGRESEL